MSHTIKRAFGQSIDQLRSLKLTHNIFAYAAGSVLFEIGNTKVLCAVTIQDSVPPFLRGKKTGWLTAEYSLLPASTPSRSVRESSLVKRNGRIVEISRLIGRCLRAVTDLERLGERTIFIDCDVLQADGGTRTASITGAFCALKFAVARWLKIGLLSNNILIDDLAAVSVGILHGQPILDLNFSEDSCVQADYNFVLTRSGNIVEIQGVAEQLAISWKQFEQMRILADKGVEQLFSFLDKHTQQYQQQAMNIENKSMQNRTHVTTR